MAMLSSCDSQQLKEVGAGGLPLTEHSLQTATWYDGRSHDVAVQDPCLGLVVLSVCIFISI